MTDVHVIHVDTGWSGANWQEQVIQGQQLVERCGFTPVTLHPQKSFPELITERKSFPTKKFQWCTTFLKALPFLTWADEKDPGCEATVILGSRRTDSRIRQDLPEYILDSEHYNGRKVWYPLYLHLDEQRNELIRRAGLALLHHRSLECDPCIHSLTTPKRFSSGRSHEIKELENLCGQKMLVSTQQHCDSLEIFDMGCGSHYVCGE